MHFPVSSVALVLLIAVATDVAGKFQIMGVQQSWCQQKTPNGIRYTDFHSKATFVTPKFNITCDLTSSNNKTGIVLSRNRQIITSNPNMIKNDPSDPRRQFIAPFQIDGVCTDATGAVAKYTVPAPTNLATLPKCMVATKNV